MPPTSDAVPLIGEFITVLTLTNSILSYLRQEVMLSIASVCSFVCARVIRNMVRITLTYSGLFLVPNEYVYSPMKAAHTHTDIKVYKIDRGQNYTQKRKKTT